LVPVVLLLVPAIKILPALYRWRMTSRIYRWYGALQRLERDALNPSADAARREDLVRHLDHIESAVVKIEVPPAFGDLFYGVRVVGAYFPNGQAPGSEKFDYKMQWLRALREWLSLELQRHPKLVLLGDFNIAPEDRDVHDPVQWAGQIHCTDEEREHFRGLLGLGLHDAFRLFEQAPKSWSWWDYRNLAFRKNQGLRIDHILVSDALRAAVKACTIDKLPRKNERPSDHAPVV